MSVDTPPIYNTVYNSQFFPDSATGLNRAQANKLYLQKTVTDTATALETFSGGLKTNTILPSGNSSCFSDATNTLITEFGSGSYVANFGLNSINCRFGEGVGGNFELGRYMPSSAVRIAVGGCIDTSQLTNIALGTTTGNDTLSGSGKIAIGGASMNVFINSDATTIGRTSGTSTTMNGNVSFQSPLILGTQATLSTQMGYQLTASGTATSTGTTVFLIGAGLASLPVGQYILNGSCSFPSATFTFIKVCFYASTTLQSSGTSIVTGSNNVPYGSLIINESSQVGSGINLYPLCVVINVVSGTQFYSIMANMNPVSAVSMTMNITATRIA